MSHHTVKKVHDLDTKNIHLHR